MIDLKKLNATQGFQINGAAPGDYTGLATDRAGDINADGIDDVVIGADMASPVGRANAGAAYVVYGRNGGYNTSVDLHSINNDFGFSIIGALSADRTGYSVAGIGDVNADGIEDIAVAANAASPLNRTTAGTVYVLYGRKYGYTDIDLGSTFTNAQGFAVFGAAAGDGIGYVSAAGDINNDGIADFAIGTGTASPKARAAAGEVYVVYGKSGGYPSGIDLAKFNKDYGWQILGSSAGDNCGVTVSAAGDVNKDGVDDLVIGAYQASPQGRTQAGSAYVIYGTSDEYANSVIDLNNFDNIYGFQIYGGNSYYLTGSAVSGAGDFNSDGISDIIIKAANASLFNRDGAGADYVIYGKKYGYNAPIDLKQLDPYSGFKILGADPDDNINRAGGSVAGVGDINGDGMNDVLVGFDGVSVVANRTNDGASYVLYGNKGNVFTYLDLAKLNDTQGFIIEGAYANDRSGVAVSDAGDINNDGIPDMLIGAYEANPFNRTAAGTTYVLYGDAGAKCILIAEAGSSKTAFSSFSVLEDNTLKRMQIAGKDKYSNPSVNTKIDEYAQGQMGGAAKYVSDVLFDLNIVNHLRSNKCTFYWGLVATGGMRNNVQDDNVQEAFYSAVRKGFESYTPMQTGNGYNTLVLKKADTIMGDVEGVYAWKTFAEKKGTDSHAILDLGGETAQFANGTDIINDPKQSYSFEIGVDRAMRELDTDASSCYNDQNLMLNSVKYDGIQCRMAMNNYLSNNFTLPFVEYNRYTGGFFTIGGFYNYFNDICKTYLPYAKTHQWDINPTALGETEDLCAAKSSGKTLLFGVGGLQNMTDEFCAHWGDTWDSRKDATYDFARKACFIGNYGYSLLSVLGLKTEHAIALDFSGDDISVENSTWDLGAAVDILGELLGW